MANKKPNKEAVEKRMAEMKQAMVNVLKEMPIIEVAVKRIGISRDTFYRWKLKDKEFEKHSQEAMAQGIDFINDMSESQIISLIKEKKMPSIRYWLKHNHPKYRERLEITTVSQPQEELNDEQEAYVREALRLSKIQESEVKIDENYFEDKDEEIKSGEQVEIAKQPPGEKQEPIDPLAPIKMTQEEFSRLKGEITKPIIVNTTKGEVTYGPHQERITKLFGGGTFYCPPNSGYAPTLKPIQKPPEKPNNIFQTEQR